MDGAKEGTAKMMKERNEEEGREKGRKKGTKEWNQKGEGNIIGHYWGRGVMEHNWSVLKGGNKFGQY
jgi:hypothetical protein